jgi:hypothetical protein
MKKITQDQIDQQMESEYAQYLEECGDWGR